MTNTNQKRKAIFPKLLHIIPLRFIIVIKPFPTKVGKWKERRRQLGVAVIARPPRDQCGEVDHLVPRIFVKLRTESNRKVSYSSGAQQITDIFKYYCCKILI
ncbi:unnamed protein product [Brassica oleracea]